MSVFKEKYKTLLIVIIAIIVSAVVYTMFLSEDDGILLTSDTSSDVDIIIGEDLLGLLLNIRNIKLDETIFTDPIFNSLEDFGQVIAPEPVGRNNPFIPVN